MLTNRVYDVLKWIAQIALPAAGALYYSVAQVWGLPNAEQVVGTIVAVDTFLGALLGVAASQYNKSDASVDGTMTVTDGQHLLELFDDPELLQTKDKVVFRVSS